MKIRITAALAMAAVSLQVQAFPKDKKKDPAEIGDRNVAKGLNFYSLDQELALGKQLAIEVEKQAKIVDDPIVSEYINRLGQNLARNSDVTFPVTFKLIEADEINAFTLPGGFIFVNTGLLKLSAERSGAGFRDRTRKSGTPPRAMRQGKLPETSSRAWAPFRSRQWAASEVSPSEEL